MRTIAKLALGGLMLAGTAAATMAPANAGVSIGVNVGVPGVAAGYGHPCLRDYRYRPAYCAYPAYGSPLFVDGAWYRGPVAYRYDGGSRYFWIHNGWVRDRDDFHHAGTLRGDHDGWRR